jgi:excisionase family DNA binding protein
MCQAWEGGLTVENQLEPLLTSEEVGKVLGIHPKVVERMAKRRDLPSLKVGRFWRYRASALDGWINSRLKSESPTVLQGDSK